MIGLCYTNPGADRRCGRLSGWVCGCQHWRGGRYSGQPCKADYQFLWRSNGNRKYCERLSQAGLIPKKPIWNMPGSNAGLGLFLSACWGRLYFQLIWLNISVFQKGIRHWQRILPCGRRASPMRALWQISIIIMCVTGKPALLNLRILTMKIWWYRLCFRT